MSVLKPFADWAALPNLAALHAATTGFRGEVVELALIGARGQTLFLERVSPSCPVEAGAQTFHGIGDADLAGLPTIAHHWPRLAELFGAHQVVAYNAEFFVEAISRTLDAAMPAGWQYPDGDEPGFSVEYQPFYSLSSTAGCVMNAYAPVFSGGVSFMGRPRTAKFGVACDREGIETADLPGLETAYGSAHRTLRLVQALAARAGGA